MAKIDTTNKVPGSWSFATINEMVGEDGLFRDGDWVESKDQDPNGEIRLIQLADIGDEDFKDKSCRFLTRQKALELNCTFLKPNDILVARMPDPLGRACIFPIKGEEKHVTVVDVCIIRIGKRAISHKYLSYLINSLSSRKEIESYKTGSTRKRISRKNLGKIKFPVAPLEEQQRIVSKLEELFSELDKGIESFKTAREQLKVYRQAVLKHAFEGKLTEEWRKQHADELESAEALLKKIKTERKQRYQQQLADWEKAVTTWEAGSKEGKKPTKPGKLKELPPLTEGELAELPELPENWIWEKLSWMTMGVEYGTSAKSQETGKVPVLRMGNIQNFRFDWSDLVFSDDENEINKYRLKNGDVLFNRTNSPELVGKTAIYQGEQEAIFAGYLIRVKQITIIANPKFLNYFLNSYVAKIQGNKVKTDGVNQSNINGVKLTHYPFPYCSLNEQEEVIQQIESRLSVVEKLEQDIEVGLRQAETLRQSLLKKAFEGKLVAQDPNDEPASVLLERIKAEKAEQEKKAGPKNQKKMKLGV